MATFDATIAGLPIIYEIEGATPPPAPSDASVAIAAAADPGLRSSAPALGDRASLGAVVNDWPWSVLQGALMAVPAKIDLATVVSESERTVYLWNTTSAALTAEPMIATGNDGLAVEGWTSAVTVIPPRRSAVLSLTASPVGPLAIAATFTFPSEGEAAVLLVVGARGILFGLRPLRARDYEEARTWPTATFRAIDGTSHTRALIPDDGPPARSVSIPAEAISPDELGRVINRLRFGAAHGLFVPLWLSASVTTAPASGTTIPAPTGDREFIVGAWVAIIDEAASPATSAVRRIASMTADAIVLESPLPDGLEFPTGSIVLPLLTAAIPDQAAISALDYSRGRGSIDLTELAHEAAAAAPVIASVPNYSGRDRFPLESFEVAEAEVGVVSTGDVVGEAWQAREIVWQREGALSVQVSLILEGLEERALLRRWFDRLKGPHALFWMPSGVACGRFFSSAGAGAESFSLKASDEAFGMFGVARHVWIPALGQAVEIANARDGSGGETIVDCTPALDGDIEAGEVVEFLILGRMAQESLAFSLTGLAREAGEETTVASFAVLEEPASTPTLF